jgi:hypothetical protein
VRGLQDVGFGIGCWMDVDCWLLDCVLLVLDCRHESRTLVVWVTVRYTRTYVANSGVASACFSAHSYRACLEESVRVACSL